MLAKSVTYNSETYAGTLGSSLLFLHAWHYSSFTVLILRTYCENFMRVEAGFLNPNNN